MSYDLAVWLPVRHLTAEEAGELYSALSPGHPGVVSHTSIDKFYKELIERYPELDEVPEDRVDDTDYCPWSCALERSAGYVVMSCVYSKAGDVLAHVKQLARKHGLAVFDPQVGEITYPGPPPPRRSSNGGETKRGRGKQTLHAVIFKDGETKEWVATCLEYNLSVEGLSEDAVREAIEDLMQQYIDETDVEELRALREAIEGNPSIHTFDINIT